jgi:hypothetical protein
MSVEGIKKKIKEYGFVSKVQKNNDYFEAGTMLIYKKKNKFIKGVLALILIVLCIMIYFKLK